MSWLMPHSVRGYPLKCFLIEALTVDFIENLVKLTAAFDNLFRWTTQRICKVAIIGGRRDWIESLNM